MPKRLDYLLYDLAVQLLGKSSAEAAVAGVVSNVVKIPQSRRSLESNLRRIHLFTHQKEPAPGGIDSMIQELAALYAQMLINSYTIPRHPEEYLKNSEPEFLPALQTLLNEGRGAMLVTPHFGDQGMIYGALAYLGIPVTVMINEALAYQWATKILKTLRFIGLGEGAVEGLKTLRNNKTLMMNGDMDYFPEGRTADLFGAPFPPPHGVSRLALAARSPILPVYSVCQGGRHRLMSDEPIRSDGNLTQEDIERRIMRSMESFIGRYPSHWFVFEDPWNLQERERRARRQLRGIVLRGRLSRRWMNMRRSVGL